MVLNNSGTARAYRSLSTSFSRLERDTRRRGAFSLYWDSNAFALAFVIKYLVTNIKKYYESRKIFHYMCLISKEPCSKGSDFGLPLKVAVLPYKLKVPKVMVSLRSAVFI